MPNQSNPPEPSRTEATKQPFTNLYEELQPKGKTTRSKM